MEIKTSINLAGVNNLLKRAKVKAADEKRALKIAALEQVREIKTRTAKGEGLRGPFKRYSREHAEFRKERGHAGTVNLFLTGDMLGNLNLTTLNSDKAIIGFSAASERKKAEANQKLRPFMGITPSEQKLIRKRFERALFK